MALLANPPTSVGMVFRLSPLGELKQMTGELGPGGAGGLGSGTVAVIATGGNLTGVQPNAVAAAVAALMDGQLSPGNPPYTYQSRWVVDLGAGTVNTY